MLQQVAGSRAMKRLRLTAQARLATSGRSAFGLGEECVVLGDGLVPATTDPAERVPGLFEASVHAAPVEQWPAVRLLRRRQRAKSAPAMTIPEPAVDALKAATASCRVVALPAFKVDKRTAKRSLASSSIKERFQKWWAGPDGVEWRQQRAELLVEPGVASSSGRR